MSLPLVSIITPSTPDRAAFIERLTPLIKAQTYPNIEWLIDDLPGLIGEKRNRLCERAKGEYIAHLDSDDLYSADWIEKSIAHMMDTGADLTGLNRCYFASNDFAWLYEYVGSQPYTCGATMVYKRSMWERNPFPASNEGEDAIFCANAGRVIPHKFKTGFIATIHGNNTASYKALAQMEKVPYDRIQRILNDIL